MRMRAASADKCCEGAEARPTRAADRPAMDPVTFEVIRNALLNMTEEMAVTIRRAAFSTNIKTRADFSCAFFDTQLRCIAQSFAQPAHLVAMIVIAPNAIREYGPENFKAGRCDPRQRSASRLEPPQRHHRHHAGRCRRKAARLCRQHGASRRCRRLAAGEPRRQPRDLPGRHHPAADAGRLAAARSTTTCSS